MYSKILFPILVVSHTISIFGLFYVWYYLYLYSPNLKENDQINVYSTTNIYLVTFSLNLVISILEIVRNFSDTFSKFRLIMIITVFIVHMILTGVLFGIGYHPIVCLREITLTNTCQSVIDRFNHIYWIFFVIYNIDMVILLIYPFVSWVSYVKFKKSEPLRNIPIDIQYGSMIIS